MTGYRLNTQFLEERIKTKRLAVCDGTKNTPDLWGGNINSTCIYSIFIISHCDKCTGERWRRRALTGASSNHYTLWNRRCCFTLHVLMVTEDGGRGIRLRVTLNPLKIIILICKTGWRCSWTSDRRSALWRSDSMNY